MAFLFSFSHESVGQIIDSEYVRELLQEPYEREKFPIAPFTGSHLANVNKSVITVKRSVLLQNEYGEKSASYESKYLYSKKGELETLEWSWPNGERKQYQKVVEDPNTIYCKLTRSDASGGNKQISISPLNRFEGSVQDSTRIPRYCIAIIADEVKQVQYELLVENGFIMELKVKVSEALSATDCDNWYDELSVKYKFLGYYVSPRTNIRLIQDSESDKREYTFTVGQDSEGQEVREWLCYHSVKKEGAITQQLLEEISSGSPIVKTKIDFKYSAKNELLQVEWHHSKEGKFVLNRKVVFEYRDELPVGAVDTIVENGESSIYQKLEFSFQ